MLSICSSVPGLPHDNGTGPDLSCTLIILFLVSHFNFLFIECGRLSWLPVIFLLHVKYTLSYCIVYLSVCLSPEYKKNDFLKNYAIWSYGVY